MSPLNEDQEPVLLVDDNPANLQVLIKALEDLGHKIYAANTSEDALCLARTVQPAVVLVEMSEELLGYEMCRQLKQDFAARDLAIILLSSLEGMEDKVKDLEVEVITKPFLSREVQARVKNQLTIRQLRRTLNATVAKLSRELEVVSEMVAEANRRVEGPLLGSSEAIQKLRSQLEALADERAPLLLHGSPGSGQETVARAYHLSSPRRANPFFYVNCASLEPQQAARLFGFNEETNAVADGGTIFLDHVHQLRSDIQGLLASLLRRMRETKGVPILDIRIVAYAASPLAHEATKGTFDPALLSELQTHPIYVPSLAERREDIPVLAEFFLHQHARRLGCMVEGFAPGAMAQLQEYSWPGSVQELRSLIERRLTVTQEPRLSFEPHCFEGIALGGYQLVERLGQGGMGEVWRAKHRLLARPAAVKLVRPDPTWSQSSLLEIQSRFEREARATAQLHSPNTVHLYDFGVDEADGTFYYVMELLRGLDLGEIVGRFGRCAQRAS